MKKLKRTLALVLSFVMASTSIPAFVSAETTNTAKATFATTLSSTAQNPNTVIMPTENQAGAPAITDGVSVNAYKAKNTGDNNWTYTAQNITGAYNSIGWGIMVDGVTTQTENLGIPYYADCVKDGVAYLDGSKMFADIVLDLGDYYSLKGFNLIGGHNDGTLNPGSYEIYATKEFDTTLGKDNFNSESLVVKHINDVKGDGTVSARSQYFFATQTIVARYVCLRVLNPVAEKNKIFENIPASWENSSWMMDLRITEFRAYGTKATADDIGTVVKLESSNDNQTVPTEGTIADGVTLTQYVAHRESTDVAYTYTKTDTNVNSMFNSTAFNGESWGTNNGRVTFVDTKKQEAYIDGTRAFADYVYDLGAYYDISKISIVHGTTDGGLATGKYQLFASPYFIPSKGEKCVSTDTMLVDYENKDQKKQQTFAVAENGKKVIARYVILRIINPIPYKYASGTDIPENWLKYSYFVDVRLSQFRVYGTFARADALSYDTPTSNYFDFADTCPATDNAEIAYFKNDGTQTAVSTDTYSLRDNSEKVAFTSADIADGGYATVTYDLKRVRNIKNIVALSGVTEGEYIGKYEVYASNSRDTLYTSANKIYEVDASAIATSRQLAEYAKTGTNTLSARYVGMKVLKPTASADTKLHLREFNVYSYYDGFTYSGVKHNDVDTTAGAKEYENFAHYSKNLIADKVPEGSWKTATESGDIGINTNITTSSDTFSDITIGNGKVLYIGERDENNQLLSLKDDENNYYQLTWQLNTPSAVNAFAFFGHRNVQWSPYHLAVSFADSKADLFTENANKTVDFYSLDTYGKISLDTAVNCQWVAVRILCGIKPSFIGTTVPNASLGNYYARVYHFDVFGNYQNIIDGSTVTVTSDIANSATKGALSGATDNDGNYTVGAKIKLTAKANASRDGVVYYPFKGWYEGENLLSTEREYNYTITDTENHTVTAKYEDEKSRAVTFIANGSIIYTAYTKTGTKLDRQDIYKASELVSERFGLYKKLDKNLLQIWDDDVYGDITADKTVNALYKQSDTTYSVNITYTDGTTQNLTKKFDERLDLSDFGATLWEVNGTVAEYGTTATMYVFGDMQIVAKNTAVQAEQASVTIVRTNGENNSLTVLAKINNPTGKKVTECGVRFVTGTSYAKLGDNNWTDAYVAEKGVKVLKGKINNLSGNEFMATLKNVQSKNNAVRRVAQAYMVLEDGEEFYSNVMYQDFTQKLQNPIIPYESGNTSDPFFVYENGVYYQPYNKDSNLYVIHSATVEGLATAFADGNYQTVYTADSAYSSFYAPEIHKMDDGYWYIYSAPQYRSDGAHKMTAVKSKTTDIADGFTNEVTEIDYDANVFLSIDGTVLKYGGKNYFIWSEQGCMRIAEMESPTKLKGEQVNFLTPKYSWEKQVYSLVEGPAILYHGDKVFMSYSASDSQSDFYAIGLLELTGTDPLDPNSWTRVSEKPVVSKTDSVFGPGHNSFLTVKENGYDVTYIVYHAHLQSTDVIGSAWNGRTVFMQRVYWDENGYPRFMAPSADICE